MGRPRYQRPSVQRTSPKHGRARWYIRVMVDVLADRARTVRREKTLYLGYCDEMGKREAEKAAAAQLTQVNNTPLVIQSQVIFKDLAAAYRTTYLPGLKPSSRYVYEHRLHCHILPRFADMPLHRIDAVCVQGWVYELQDAGLSRATRQGMLNTLRSLFDAAEDWGYTTGRNPCKKTKVGPGLEVHKRAALDPQAVLRLVAVCEEPLRLIVEIATYTGLRVSEILGLTWDALDLHTGTGTVLQAVSQQHDVSTPKSVKGRRTFELGPLVKRLVRPPTASGGDLVWPHEDQRALQHRLARRASTVGLSFKGFGFHTLRRTYATLRDSLGARKPDAALVTAMGHASGAMTEHYISRQDAGVVDRLMELVNFSGVSRESQKPN